MQLALKPLRRPGRVCPPSPAGPQSLCRFRAGAEEWLTLGKDGEAGAHVGPPSRLHILLPELARLIRTLPRRDSAFDYGPALMLGKTGPVSLTGRPRALIPRSHGGNNTSRLCTSEARGRGLGALPQLGSRSHPLGAPTLLWVGEGERPTPPPRKRRSAPFLEETQMPVFGSAKLGLG